MEQQKARAAPHHHPRAEPRGSAGARTEPTTPWLDQHKASLQVDSATEPRPLQRCDSGKSALPYKNTTALGPAHHSRATVLPTAAMHRSAQSPSTQPTGFPHLGCGKPQSREQRAWNLGMTPGASSFLLSHRIVPLLPNTPNHPQFAF